MDQQRGAQFVLQTNDNHSMAESSNLYNDGTQFQFMPEDCLLEIFSVRSFDLMDMCSIAETCKRFRSISRRVIGKTICFKGERYCSFKSNRFDHRTDKRSDIETIFRNFGSCLSTVFVFAVDERPECFLFDLIVTHCGEVLKCLILLHLRISVTLATDLKPIFKRLNTLSLSAVSIEGSKSTFAGLDSLVDLEVSRVKNCATILDNIFPRLQHFTYQKDTIEMTENDSDSAEQDQQSLETICAFLARHSTLQSLDIDFECDQNCWMVILQTIGDSCTKLRKLTIGTGCDRRMFSSDLLQSLQALTSLRILKLTGVSFQNFQVFASMLELRELELQHCTLPRKVDHFACLDQLTNLCLIDSETKGGDSDIAGQMVRLLELQYLVLDATSIPKIVDIVKRRSTVLTSGGIRIPAPWVIDCPRLTAPAPHMVSLTPELTLICESAVNCDEAFQQLNGCLVMHAEDRFVAVPFGSAASTALIAAYGYKKNDWNCSRY